MRRKRNYDLMPELAPILIAALFGLIIWLFALDALAEGRRLADYLDPCSPGCGSTFYRDEERRSAQRQQWEQQEQWARERRFQDRRRWREERHQEYRDLYGR